MAATLSLSEAFVKIFGLWKKYNKADSFVRFTQVTRAEPIVILDQRAQSLDYISDVMQSLLALFAAYYLQAAALQTNVGSVNVGKFLGPLNPNRPTFESLNQALSIANGQGTHKSTLFQSLEDTSDVLTDIAAKGDILSKRFIRNNEPDKGAKSSGNGGKTAISDTFSKGFNESVDLSVGRMYNVTITDNGNSATIPVMIRLLTSVIPSSLLVHILSDGAKVSSSTAKERWYAYKSGELKFWRDLVFAQDLIDEHRQALIEDNTGIYHEILKRRRGNAVSAAVNMGITVATASNMVVITRQTLRELEAAIGGKFENPEVRQKVFERTFLMIVVVIDPDYDHLTFYHRGINLPSELSVRDIKRSNKGNGPDIGELLKMYVMGKAPSF